MRLTVYTKPGCHLCEQVLQTLDRLSSHYALEVHEANILGDTALYDLYRDKIPVIEAANGEFGRLEAPITEPELRAYLDLASGNPPNPVRQSVIALQRREPFFERLAGSIGRHWLLIFCVVLGLFVGLAWVTPIFAALGWWDVANFLYSVYALTCHQLPERCGTLFGYQVAFCFRNTALYGGILLFGILYGLARDRRWPALRWLRRPAAWWVFVLLLLPMAIDGGTHLLGMRDGLVNPTFSPVYGSFWVGSQIFSLNWWLRIITGLIAALGAVWFAFPRVDKAVDDAEALRQFYAQSALRSQPAAVSASQ